ncbi:DUF397 domain-containing protein [Actinomadura kijaniata]|uniref:DUF397 domain-containing protein n=1 Tax=Actinomadura kijaniata TaxID=46161 RepID=UPI003F1BE765
MDPSEPTWRMASRSADNGGNCVEVASVLGTVVIRDSKNPSGANLLINCDEARALSECIKDS